MTEWTELKTLQDVAAAQARGDEIEVGLTDLIGWGCWNGEFWGKTCLYRSRPRKQTKKIVLREALVTDMMGNYLTTWIDTRADITVTKWLDTPERVIEVEE